MKDKILVITGPTATGKSYIAYRFAADNDAEVISCDSMQVYKHMDIGTAKPPEAYMNLVKHHMIDIIEPTNEYSAGQYKKEALEVINDVIKRGKLPIITGGTGLYLNSIIFDLDLSDVKNNDKKTKYYEEYYNNYGKEALFELLRQKDALASERIHPNNIKRVIRALYIASDTKNNQYESAFKSSRETSFDFRIAALTKSREALYHDINTRVDDMINNGLIDEVDYLLKRGMLASKTALQAIGYKELIGYLNKDIDLADAISLIKQNTRRYAKRQLTWLRKVSGIRWIDTENKTTEQILAILEDMMS